MVTTWLQVLHATGINKVRKFLTPWHDYRLFEASWESMSAFIQA